MESRNTSGLGIIGGVQGLNTVHTTPTYNLTIVRPVSIIALKDGAQLTDHTNESDPMTSAKLVIGKMRAYNTD